jgi:hypothetical protein
MTLDMVEYGVDNDGKAAATILLHTATEEKL